MLRCACWYVIAGWGVIAAPEVDGLWGVAGFLWNAYSAGSDAADIVRERDVIVKWMAFLGTSIWGPLFVVCAGAIAYAADVFRSRRAPSMADWHDLKNALR